MKYIGVFLFFFTSVLMQAQHQQILDPETDRSKDDSDYVMTEILDASMDSLLNSWYVKHYINQINHEGYNTDIELSDSVYQERLSKLPTIISMPYNKTVEDFIKLYTQRRRNLVEYMLGLEALYFPMIEETLDKYGLPDELKYLVVVESALNPTALSRAGASGMWQFMLGTGKKYGLEINSLIDERLDPVKATDAACQYLKALNELFFGNWDLAIAAYNCGEGNVSKAIRRAGGKTDFWEIYRYLPKETRAYLPLFIAANYVMNYYPYHQLYPVQTSQQISTDTVMINEMLHLDQIAAVLQMDKEEIRALNPQYRRDIIPGHIKPYPIKLPAIKAYAFVEKYDSIVNYQKELYFASNKFTSNTREKIIHKVVSGENLVTIASKYGVTPAEIRKWNGLRSNRVGVGRRITVYINNGGIAYAATQQSPAKASSTAAKSANSAKKTTATASTGSYKVKSGETYSTIANKLGYTAQQLMKLNNTSSSALKTGQIIRVPKM
ncbi:MAG: transglycosylase SLT domain-containing protein [Dysgonamonadaceae bacterium]|jgi:membrane-bound lytic murein transglycosylase D|nr:transglycosylase SLT domain-containing protein [Dysgonamonadaceae bacterium]